MAQATDESHRIVRTADIPPVDSLVLGFTEIGLAGLTAVDYLTEHLGMAQVGHLTGGGPPHITPFEDGRPRHHTRLFADVDTEMAVLMGERMVPMRTVPDLAATLADLCQTETISSLTILTGVPVAHGPDDHIPFHIATPDYAAAHLQDTDITAMGTGFVDGLPAELLRIGLETDLAVGVFTTPAHPQAPDAAAAIRLLRALSEAHDLALDTEPLEAFAQTVESQYRALAERVSQAESESMPDDRMYM